MIWVLSRSPKYWDHREFNSQTNECVRKPRETFVVGYSHPPVLLSHSFTSWAITTQKVNLCKVMHEFRPVCSDSGATPV